MSLVRGLFLLLFFVLVADGALTLNKKKGQAKASATQLEARKFLREGFKQCKSVNNWIQRPNRRDWDFSLKNIMAQAYARVQKPQLVFQGEANWCGYATIIRMMAELDPRTYARFVLALYCDRKLSSRGGLIWSSSYNFYYKNKYAIAYGDVNSGGLAEVDMLLMYPLNDESSFLGPGQAGEDFAHGASSADTISQLLRRYFPDRCATTTTALDHNKLLNQLALIYYNAAKVKTSPNEIDGIIRAQLEATPVILLVSPQVLWKTAGTSDYVMNLFSSHWIRLVSVKLDKIPSVDPATMQVVGTDYTFTVVYSDTTQKTLEVSQDFTWDTFANSLLKNILLSDVKPVLAQQKLSTPAQGDVGTVMCVPNACTSGSPQPLCLQLKSY